MNERTNKMIKLVQRIFKYNKAEMRFVKLDTKLVNILEGKKIL